MLTNSTHSRVDILSSCRVSMIIAFERLKCHLVEYGRLMDASTGLPMRAFRRDILRRTADYPIGCQSQALPRRIAGNVCALPNLLDPAHDAAGALLINPSYARAESGALFGAYVTAQRLTLSPREDDPRSPGDAVRSKALTFAFDDFCAQAPRLGEALGKLRATPVWRREPAGKRLAEPMAMARLAAPAYGESPASAAILAAAMLGLRLRLDERWLERESDFLNAYLAALGALPARARGHVSAAAGLTAPDLGFQIVWTADGCGLDPEAPRAKRLIAFGRRAFEEPLRRAFPPFAAAPDFPSEDGLLGASWEAPELHCWVREQMRARLAPDAATGFSAEDARRLICEGGEARASRSRDPFFSRAAMSCFSGLAPAGGGLAAAVEALEIIDAADFCVESDGIGRARRFAVERILAALAAHVVIDAETLAILLESESFARALAAEISAGAPRAETLARRTLTMIAQSEGASSAMLRRVAGRLLPRDYRLTSEWLDYDKDFASLAEAMLDLANDALASDEQAVATLAAALLHAGRWNLVREALGRLTQRLGRACGDAAPDPQLDAKRLRLIAALAEPMRDICERRAEDDEGSRRRATP